MKEAGPSPDLAHHCEVLSRCPLIAQPGALWHYGSGLTVLGRCIEIWSGQPFDVFLAEHLFEPLGMVDCGFKVPMAKLPRLVEAYRYGGPQQMAHMPSPADGGGLTARGGVPDGSGGLVGSTADYFLFAQMLCGQGVGLNGVRILGPRTVAFMASDQLAGQAVQIDAGLPAGNPPGTRLRTSFSENRGDDRGQADPTAGIGFGFGVAVMGSPQRAAVLSSPGEFWWGGAYSTVFYIDPQEQVVMLFMTQLLPTHSYPVRCDLRVAINSSILSDVPGLAPASLGAGLGRDVAARL
jgi:CubicO group peptidase (beta-lactamase class C family)